MGFLSGLVLVLFSLVGYSGGAVIGGRGRQVLPGLLDIGVLTVLWAMAVTTRPILGKWIAILIWLIVAAAVSGLLTTLRRRAYEMKKESQPLLTVKSPLQRAWVQWKAFAAEMGNYQGRISLAFFYFIIVAPFGICLRVFGDPLSVKRVRGKSFWVGRDPVSPELEKARDQF
jgi:hypothetical protein